MYIYIRSIAFEMPFLQYQSSIDYLDLYSSFATFR